MIGPTAFVAYVGSVWLANWLVSHYGVVPVGFALQAPAAVYVVGVAFTLRDLVQSTLGRWWVVAAIAAGAALSWIVSPTFAVASGVSFLVSEAADFVVYTPLEQRDWRFAVVCSNVVGLIVDSLLFLALAFGSLSFLAGQIVGKAWMTLAAMLVVSLIHNRHALLARRT